MLINFLLDKLVPFLKKLVPFTIGTKFIVCFMVFTPHYCENQEGFIMLEMKFFSMKKPYIFSPLLSTALLFSCKNLVFKKSLIFYY